jgi:poly(3-hydroxybutyrate) depolymerase
LHISFHGCHQDTAEIGDIYAQHAGYNEWAQSNNIIVLYPMAKVSTVAPMNPEG